MVWGGRRLKDVLGQTLPSDEPYGESWVISDHPHHRSVVANGPWEGRSLRELVERETSKLLGPVASRHAMFPWLVKFLDANDWLSVQVHPDTETVKKLWPGEGSKTEAWFIVDAAPGSRVYAGLLPGVDEQRLRSALETGTVADCLHQFEPKPGDCIFLPAGTVHAVGGGVLIAEVQQTSDATFRLFDWNRRDAQGKMRQLHIEQALASIHWSQGPVQPIHAEGFGRTFAKRRQPLVRCPFFDLDYREEDTPFTWNNNEKLQVVLILRGRGRLETPWGEESLAPGQAWLLPAAMKPTHWKPEPSLAMLHCTLE
jgi:mannose-6-phosphate isomerase